MIHIKNITTLFQLILLFLTSVSLIQVDNILVDITSHFKVQYFLFSLLFFVIFICLKSWKMSALAIIICLINFYEVNDYLFGKESVSTIKDKSTKIMSVNVWSDNNHYSKLINMVERENPDILVLIEINSKWDNNLKELYAKYSHIHSVNRNDNFGIVFLTNYKTIKSETKYYGNNLRTPSIKSKVVINDKKYNIISTHPVPPMSAEYYQSRNDTLLDIAKKEGDNEKTIIIGDLNNTMWSKNYKDFVKISDFKNTRQKVDYSWPTIPYLFIFGIPIDHILVPQNTYIVDFKTLDDIGSDHYPILSTIILK